MSKVVTLLLGSAVGVVLLVTLTTVALSTGKTPVVSRRNKPILEKIKRLEEQHPQGRPKATTPETEFAFGILNPNETKSHPFVIRNDGPLPLALKKGPTSCKCTVADLQDKTLFPGDDTTVSLEWNTGRSEAEFRQSATILTNDPDRPEIVFQVHGRVRLACFAEPQSLVFPDILPGRVETSQTMICSQIWERFTIANVASSIEGLSWKLEPLPPEELLALEVKSGYRLILTSPNDFAEPWLNGSLKLTAEGPDQTQPPVILELSVVGKMRPRLAVYGAQIDEKGTVDLGLLPLGQGAQVPLMIRVRDEEPSAAVREIRVRPDFLVAKVTPFEDSSGNMKPGLYRLQIEVPADAPECLHLGAHQGQVVVEFDHPRAKSIAVKLNFAIKDR